MRAAGDLPPHTQLWAVANPVTERSAALLERKVAAGAQVILTQPPQLDWAAWDRWYADAGAAGAVAGGGTRLHAHVRQEGRRGGAGRA
jgi:hypothetical protein